MKAKTVYCLMMSVVMIFFNIPMCWADMSIYTSSPFVSEETKQEISINLEDADLVDVLKVFSEQTKYNLITSQNLGGRKVTVYLDHVPVDEALEQVLRANDLTYELQPGSDIYIVKPLDKPEVGLITRVYNLKYAPVSQAKISQTLSIAEAGGGAASSAGAGLLNALKAILTPKGKIIEDTRTNSVIITDIASNFPNIEKTIARLDVSVPQVLIEVEMLEVSKETADKAGIKPGTAINFTGAVRHHLYPFDQNHILRQGEGEFGTGLSSSTDQFNVGSFDLSGVTALIQFLKTQTDSKTLARPRILTLNNETAQIKISTDEAIGVATTTIGTSAASTQAKQAERVETGVFLTVTPQANPDTNDITMAVMPKVIVARAGGTFEGQSFKDPEERGAQSILKVKNGETIVIGGLLREDMSKVTTKVPVLGDIPFIGRAFRYNDDSVKERELIIFLTPHIIKETPASAIASAQADTMYRGSNRLMVREQERPPHFNAAIAKEMATLKKKRM